MFNYIISDRVFKGSHGFYEDLIDRMEVFIINKENY